MLSYSQILIGRIQTVYWGLWAHDPLLSILGRLYVCKLLFGKGRDRENAELAGWSKKC